MDRETLKARTKSFALRIVKLTRTLLKDEIGRIIGKQLLRSGTSVAANYRAVCRGRSRADFISKLGIVVEEADETAFWLELIVESGLIDKKLVEPLLKEANEIVAIMVAARSSSIKNDRSKS